MVGWTPFHGWMAFDELAEDRGLTRAFAIGYRLTNDPKDAWTRRLNSFKAKQREALRGGAAMMGSAVPGLVGGLGLDVSKTVFVPALSSDETVASENGVLWRLAHYCAKVARAGFVGDAITKNAHERLHMYSDAHKRRGILDDADFRSKRMPMGNVLIFDDFITRGATMSHIAGAMLGSNRGLRIFGVALGKTERRSYWQKSGVEISNEHVPQRWKRIWQDV